MGAGEATAPMDALGLDWSSQRGKARPLDDRIVVVSSGDSLSSILEPEVLAVLAATPPEPWIERLSAAVRDGDLVVPRSILDGVTLPDIARFLSDALKAGALAADIRNALREDLLELVATCGALTGAGRFHFRFFTDVPNDRCSFHVDIVAPGAPTVGLIRVYCGAQTDYVDPNNLTSWEDFHAWEYLRKREALAAAEARGRRDIAAEARALSRLTRMDARPRFMIDVSNLHTVAAHTLVACKFVDSRHLLDRTHVRARSARGWIHRSPMSGSPRCVATVNAVG
jgi:hypothetical protein